MDEKLISGSFVIWTIMEFSISSPGVFKYMEIRHDKQLVETKKKKNTEIHRRSKVALWIKTISQRNN